MFGHKINDYELKCVIKETETSVVHLAELGRRQQQQQQQQGGNYLMVIKHCRTDKQNEENLRLMENEINVMKQLWHPNILEILSNFVQGADLYTVTPLMRYGSCRDVLDRFCFAGFTETIVSLIARDVLHALDYLHKRGYIHRSIRASHILLGDRAVLTGFKECACLIVDGQRIQKMHNLPTSPKELLWLAPEVLEQNLLGYTEKSDIYSFGISLCEMANNLTPFAEMSNTLMLVEKLKGNQPSLLDSSTYSVEMMEDFVHNDVVTNHAGCDDDDDNDAGVGGGGCVGGQKDNQQSNFAFSLTKTQEVYIQRKLTDSFHNFVEICLTRDQHLRPGAEKLLHHAFVKQSKHTTLTFEMEELKIDSIDAIVPANATENAISLSLGDMKIDDDEFSWDF